MRSLALLSGLFPTALPAFDRCAEITDEFPLPADPPSIEAFRELPTVAQVKHENLGEVFGGRGSGVWSDVPLRVVVGSNVGIVVRPECTLEWNTAKKSPMCVSKSVSILVAQDIPQSGP
jgi:hypothetical protein